MNHFNPYLIGSYVVLEKVATGTFVEIFKVKKGDRTFALKKLKSHLQYDRDQIEKLKIEVEILQNLKNDPHFPLLTECGEWKDEFYIILELIHGLTLKESMKKSFHYKQPFSQPLCCQIALEICRGLEHLHQIETSSVKNIVHGDLKGLNVMLSVLGEVKIIDLALGGTTFAYLPLEGRNEQVLNAFSDIYAVGHILFEMLHGRRLFQSKIKKDYDLEVKNTEIKEEIFDVALPQEVKKILVRCLNQDPSVRYQSVTELKADLENYLRQEKFKWNPNEFGEWVRKLKQLASPL